jgi:hypothetical protein
MGSSELMGSSGLGGDVCVWLETLINIPKVYGAVGALSGQRASARKSALDALAADAAGELDVLGHDGHALCVDGAQV